MKPTFPGQSVAVCTNNFVPQDIKSIDRRDIKSTELGAGTMSAGIAQENGALQNITININPGEVFTAVQGLLHYNHNQKCIPNAFFQSFDSADPGALNVIGALAAFGSAGTDGAAAILASTAEGVKASPQGAFALDQACLKRCGFPATGAPGNGLAKLPKVLRVLFGL
jgi:hypothetical protein